MARIGARIATVSWNAAMAVDVSTTTTELPESRVRVDAEVAPTEVEKRLAHAAKQLSHQIRVPGFRAGKAPAPVVVKRLGREAVLDEAVRDSIGLWYNAAIDAARIVPVGEPELDISKLPAEGEPLRFSIEIGVRPKATLGDYKGVEVGRREPEVSDEAVGEEVDALRERTARLEAVERPAASGDFIVMDYRGTIDGEPFAGGEARDQMIELGSGRLVPGFEEQLTGAAAGDERTVTITFPDDYGADDLAGKQAAPRARRRLRSRRRLRHGRRAARRHPRAPRQGRGTAHRQRVPRGRARLGGRFGHGRAAGVAGRGARSRAVGLHAPPAVTPGHRPRRLPAHHRPRRG
jgi:hypothetical protein